MCRSRARRAEEGGGGVSHRFVLGSGFDDQSVGGRRRADIGWAAEAAVGHLTQEARVTPPR
jgi:hypothetical protein